MYPAGAATLYSLFIIIPVLLIFVRTHLSLYLSHMRRLLPAVLILILAAACKKRDDGFTRALVINSGDITATGCGYLLRLQNGQEIRPIYIASAYQHDSLGVLVKFYDNGTTSNCRKQDPLEEVNVTEIKLDF